MNSKKHKLPRRILAMLLAICMFVTMFPSAMFAVVETDTVEEPTVSSGLVQGHSKSKTATELDENYQSKVTLSLPSAEEELTTDVVFVMDKSTSTKENIMNQFNSLLTSLAQQANEGKADIKIGVVAFYKSAQDVVPLTNIKNITMDQVKDALENVSNQSGTNIHAGLIAGKAMLDEDQDVDANRKYLILVSDGISYIYNQEPTSSMTIGYETSSKLKATFECTVETWGMKYGYGKTLEAITGQTSASDAVQEFLYGDNGIASKVQADGEKYDHPYDELKKFVDSEGKTVQPGDTVGGVDSGADYELKWHALKVNNLKSPISEEDFSKMYGDNADEHANNVEKAMYLVAETYKSAQEEGYHCYAVDSATNANETWPWGAELMEYLADGKEVSFDQIEKDIYYLLDAGSKVDDYMGYVKDDYNFDFVNEASALSMKVGDQPYEATKLEDNKYGFAPDGSVDDGYNYILEYYPADNGDEHFTWTTNVPVSNFAPVQLTYTVQLTNPKEEAGTYGKYDADGSEEYVGLYTNNSAVLTPIDSNGTEGSQEEFAKPTVSYTVKSKGEVLITPADITVYTGGDSYAGVINDLEDGTADQNSKGLPEPGYYLTLPDWINKELSISSDEEGTSTSANDLSNNITFTYKGKDSSTGETVTRSWPIALYYAGTDGTSYEENITIGGTTRDRYIYQIEPSGDNTVRVQFQPLDETGNIAEGSQPILSDDFELDLDTLYQQYDMTIYAGYLTQQEVKAEIKDGNGQLIATLPVKVDHGTLTVRGTTDGEEIVKVGDADNAAAVVAANTQTIDEETESTITAVADNTVDYYINDSMVSVAPEAVHLLADELVGGDNAEKAQAILKDYMVEKDIADEGANFSYQYLDLVDNTNGNAWVTPTDEVDIYWKVPKTANSEDHDFKIVHFNGLNRQYDVPTASLIGTNGYGVEEYTVENDGLDIVEIGSEEYLKFSTDTFSPFVLVWDEADNDNPPYIPPTTGDDDDDEEEPDTPALDRVNHFLYVEGYPEDYRTGEYSDNENLWPVKPQGNITRAEVATIFYRLLKDEVREEIETDVNNFPDVDKDDWFNITVSSLANMGAISGYEDGTFRPNEPISRAELASMAVRFYDAFEVEYEEGTFLDVDGDEWYADAIAAAEELGIIGGYPDGTVRPNNNITRAETCAIVNRVLERRPHDEHLGDVEDMRTWPDNQPGAWYYADMQEATNGHYYEWIDIDGSKFEEWTEVDKDYDWTKR